MRISDWSSDVCSSDLDRTAQALAPCAETEQPDFGIRVAREQRRELSAHVGHRGERGHHQRHRRYRFVGDAGIGDWGLGIGNSGSLVFAFPNPERSEEHTSELQSLMRISYAVFCLKTTKRLSLSRL